MPSTEVTFWTPVSKVWGQHGPARSTKTPTIERIDTSKKTCRIIEKLKLQGQRRRGVVAHWGSHGGRRREVQWGRCGAAAVCGVTTARIRPPTRIRPPMGQKTLCGVGENW